jgi:hypothetical protein
LPFGGLPNKTAHRRSISSNLAVAIIVGTFVGVVIIGLAVAYALPPGSGGSGVFRGISISGLTLYSGPGSTSSLTHTCNVNEAQLQVYATNNSTSTIVLTNETLYGGSLSHNGTGLVPVSNGCLPISESGAAVDAGESDFVISSFPSVDLPLGSSCYVEIQFSNGQNFTQLLVAQAE